MKFKFIDGKVFNYIIYSLLFIFVLTTINFIRVSDKNYWNLIIFFFCILAGILIGININLRFQNRGLKYNLIEERQVRFLPSGKENQDEVDS